MADPVTLSDMPLAATELGFKVGGKQILSSISIAFQRGEFVGLIGGSGSGKTTLMSCLAGIHKPTNGRVFMNRQDPDPSIRKALIGFVPQDDIVHRSLSVEKALIYACLLRVPAADRVEAQKRVGKVLELLELRDHAKTKISRLSGGQRKRVNIGLELLHAPRLFFLDEPTAGLDPALERQIMHFLKTLSNTDRVVLVTTHVLYNIDLFDLLVFIHKGHLVYLGPGTLILDYFRVKNLADIYDIVAKHTPEQLAATYQASTLYRDYVEKRLQEIS